jgi:hypothetical protein
MTKDEVGSTKYNPRGGSHFVLRISYFVLLCCLARSEIIDRVAVTIDSQPITESQVLEELRVTAFLNGEKPDLSPANRRRTADRLVEQALIRREMEFTHDTVPEGTEIEGALKAVKSRFADQAGFERELKACGIGADELGQALGRQAAVLRFIELRFRPQVQVQEAEVRQYYETVYLAECQRKQLQPASFEEARPQCEEALAQQRVDKQVGAWLAEMKGRTRIRYTEAAFQ